MALTKEITHYKSTSDSKFVETYVSFLSSEHIEESDYLLIIKLAYEYREHIDQNLPYFVSHISQYNSQQPKHNLLWSILLSMFDKNYSKDDVRKSYASYVYNNFPKLNIFDDYNTLSFYENTRFRKEAIYFITKWFTLFSVGYENLYCESCDSLLVPTFKVVDNYLCSNPACANKQVKYENHCWSCGSEINSKFNKKCGKCNWYICSECNSCMQGNKGGCKGQVAVVEGHILELKDFRLTFDEDSLFKKVLHANVQLYKQRKKANLRFKYGIELNRGTKILDTQDELAYYLVLYGEMHYIKLFSNFSKVNFPELCKNSLAVYDWGCGQGIGSLALLDYFKQNNITLPIADFKLIEPSQIALDMAKTYLSNALFNRGSSATVNCINNKLDDISEITVSEKEVTHLHIFSNILDVTSFDITKFAQQFVRSFQGNNLVFCISPNYKKSIERINEFYNIVKTTCRNTQLISVDDKYLKGDIMNVLHNNSKTKRSITNYSVIFKIN